MRIDSAFSFTIFYFVCKCLAMHPPQMHLQLFQICTTTISNAVKCKIKHLRTKTERSFLMNDFFMLLLKPPLNYAPCATQVVKKVQKNTPQKENITANMKHTETRLYSRIMFLVRFGQPNFLLIEIPAQLLNGVQLPLRTICFGN